MQRKRERQHVRISLIHTCFDRINNTLCLGVRQNAPQVVELRSEARCPSLYCRDPISDWIMGIRPTEPLQFMVDFCRKNDFSAINKISHRAEYRRKLWARDNSPNL